MIKINTNIPEKATRTIINLKNVVVKLHVKFSTDNGNAHTEYEYGKKRYLKLEPSVYLTLELVSDTWDKTKTVIITQNSIYGIVCNMKQMIDNIYNENIFANKSNGEIVAYKDMVDKYTRRMVVSGTNQQIMFRPAVIYDENELTYEGVELYINRLENKAELTIESFEALYYTISQIDLFQYSQLILNYFTNYYGKKYVSSDAPKQTKQKISFTDNSEQTEANYRPNDDKEKLFSGINTINEN